MIRAIPIRRGQRGFTIAELIIVIAVVGILASLALPIAKLSYRRQKEVELRQRIRNITNAIDRYHDLRVKGLIKDPPDNTQGEYPKDLEELVEGVELMDGKKVRFLRDRELVDPMTGEAEWDTRSSTDDRESSFTNEHNVFDVRSTSKRLSLDGKTRYNEW